MINSSSRLLAHARLSDHLVLLLAVALLIPLVWAFPILAADGDMTGFDDTGRSHIFEKEVDWLAEQGITRGCNPPDNNLFCVDNFVTRGEMAAFLTRALKLPSGSVSFDDTAGHTFETEIAALAAADITAAVTHPQTTSSAPTTTSPADRWPPSCPAP